MHIHEGPCDIVVGDFMQKRLLNNKRRKVKFKNAHDKRCPACVSNKLHSTRKRLDASSDRETS